jgi:hypothetical protein
MGWMLPSCPSPSRAGLQGLRKVRPPRLLLRVDTESSHGLAPSFRVLQASSRRRLVRAPEEARPRHRHPPLRSPAPSASPRTGQRLFLARLASPDRLRLQVFSTSWRLHPPRAWWPCFMPHPLMGLRPSELCSSRAAVRRLRRLLPSCRSDEPEHRLTRTANGRNRPPHAPPHGISDRSR